MPREGVFARVVEGGSLRAGDEVVVVAIGEGVCAADAFAAGATSEHEARSQVTRG